MVNRDTRRVNPAPVNFRTNLDVVIHVENLAKAESFYGDVLGFRLVSRSEDHLEYDSGALRLYICVNEVPASFIPSLEVNDLESARQHLEDVGCTLVPRPGGGYYVRDPFGFMLDLVEVPPG